MLVWFAADLLLLHAQLGPILDGLKGGLESIVRFIVNFVAENKKALLMIVLAVAAIIFVVYILRNNN